MKIDNSKDLIVDIEARIIWRDEVKSISEQVSRDTINHKVRAMGDRFKYLIEDIITNMVDLET